jgi:type I restriction enzyme M protein
MRQQKIDQKDIYNAAWAACDTFRGVVDPAQYKDYILVMLINIVRILDTFT